QTDIDPGLLPLADHGGPTRTMPLDLLFSPARDAGNPATPGSGGTSCEATDQRHTPRPFDGDGDSVAVCDLGAHESGGGNSAVDPGEQCDGSPCCTALCTFAPVGTPCGGCTTCAAGGACTVVGAANSCRQPPAGQGVIVLKKDKFGDVTKDKLNWKFKM